MLARNVCRLGIDDSQAPREVREWFRGGDTLCNARQKFATAVSVSGAERGMRLVESQRGMAALILRKNGEQTEVFTSQRFSKVLPAE